MLDTSNLSQFLKGITDAIRAKKGTTEPIEHAKIDEEIESIEGGDPYQILRDKFFYSERTDYAYAFNNSKMTEDDISKMELDTSNGTSFNNMFAGCSNLTTIPQLDTSNGKYFYSMFNNCYNLITIPQLNLINDTIGFSGMFENCTSLENISFVSKCINKSISFKHSDKLTDESIQSIIDGLAVVSTAQTLTFNETVKAKLTEEQIATINEKGWTLA